MLQFSEKKYFYPFLPTQIEGVIGKKVMLQNFLCTSDTILTESIFLL